MDTVREICTTPKNHYAPCDVISMIFAYYSKQNFSRKKQNNELLLYQPILRYLYSETTKRGVKFRCINTLSIDRSPVSDID